MSRHNRLTFKFYSPANSHTASAILTLLCHVHIVSVSTQHFFLSITFIKATAFQCPIFFSYLTYCTQLSHFRFSFLNILVTPWTYSSLKHRERLLQILSVSSIPVIFLVSAISFHFTCSLYRPHDCFPDPIHKQCYSSGPMFPSHIFMCLKFLARVYWWNIQQWFILTTYYQFISVHRCMVHQDHKILLNHYLWKNQLNANKKQTIRPDYMNSYKYVTNTDNRYYSLLRDITSSTHCH